MTVGFSRKDAGRIATTVRRVEGKPLGRNAGRSKHKNRGDAGGDTYAGPFKVVIKNYADVLVLGYSEGGGDIHNYVIAGLHRFEYTGGDKTVSTSSSSGVVYAHIDYSSPNYRVNYFFAPDLPAQTLGNVYVTLAYVAFSGGAITSVTQIQFGEIHVAGRIV